MASQDETDLREEKIYISQKRYLPLGVLTAIVLWLLSGSYWALNKFILEPKESIIREKQAEIEELKIKNKSALQSLETLQVDHQTLMNTLENPVLLAPLDRDRIISKQVEFKWDYSKHQKDETRYIIEIRLLGNNNSEYKRYNVPHSNNRTFYYPIKDGFFGEYFWRIKPGRIIGNKEVSQGTWSEYNSFTVYNSVQDRILDSGKILVGMSPTFSGSFNLYDAEGGFKGFDIDLINGIAARLSEKYKKDLKVQIIEVPWSKLLEQLRQYELDMVISSMTKTLKRQEVYRVKYTVGYFTSHQIFVTKDLSYDTTKSFRENLSGKRVGVTQDTTNERIAQSLSPKYGFTIRNDFPKLAAVLQALFEGDIDLAITDNTLAMPEIKLNRLDKFGGYLDEELGDEVRQYNKENIGWEQEEYAIAIHEGETQLLKDMNTIIKSQDIQQLIQELSKNWNLNELN